MRRKGPIKAVAMIVFSAMFCGAFFILHKNAPERSIASAKTIEYTAEMSSNGAYSDDNESVEKITGKDKQTLYYPDAGAEEPKKILITITIEIEREEWNEKKENN